MTLFESNSQHREKATIRRVLSLLPLYASLAQGKIWRWFAVNIPMRIVEGTKYTSDIDIIAKLHNFPISTEWIYKSWEVKVVRIHSDGQASSLKSGKTARIVTQLSAYRNFGTPSTSLLEIHLCEAGTLGHLEYPSDEVANAAQDRGHALAEKGFGYQILPFEHENVGDVDVGLRALQSSLSPIQTTINLEEPAVTPVGADFAALVQKLDAFYEEKTSDLRDGNSANMRNLQITYCGSCRGLQLVNFRQSRSCPTCGSDLIEQT